MVEDRDNLNSPEKPQNDGHEFLPLDFSEEKDKKDSLKDLRKKYFPSSISESEETDSDLEKEKPPEKSEEKPEVVETAKPEETPAVVEEAKSTEPSVKPEEKSEEKPEVVETAKPEEKPEVVEEAKSTEPPVKPEVVEAEEKVASQEPAKKLEEDKEDKKAPANLHEIFPEDKVDDDEFPKAEHKRDPEVEKIKQKFELETPHAEKPAIPKEEKKETLPKTSTPSAGVKLSPKREPIRIVGSISSKNASFGQILQEARVRSGLSLNQVEQATKIKMQYLESIERDDLKNLPPLVYVNAYVKNLCSLYNISPQETDLILSNVKQDAGHVVSEEIIHHLEDEKQINTEEEQRTKRFIVLAGAIILGIVAIIATIGIFLAYTMSSGEEDIQETVASAEENPETTAEAGKKFESKKLELLILPQNFSMDELPPPDSRN